MQTRSGVRGRPPPKRWVFLCSGRSGAMACQRSSGMRQSSGWVVRPWQSLRRTPIVKTQAPMGYRYLALKRLSG